MKDALVHDIERLEELWGAINKRKPTMDERLAYLLGRHHEFKQIQEVKNANKC